MILKYFGFLTAVFSKQQPNDFLRNNHLNDNFAYFAPGNFSFIQPRFNESCDSDSLDAAKECEDRV